MGEPWERRPGETAKAYGALLIYRDLGGRRSLSAAAREYGAHVSVLRQWSVRWGWVERVGAWDAELDRQARQAQVTEVRRMAERHAHQAQEAQEAAMAPVRAVIERIRSDPDWMARLSEIPLEEAVELALAAAARVPTLQQAERLARGEPTEIVADRVVAVETSGDDLARVVAALEQAGLSVGAGAAAEDVIEAADEPD